MEMTDTIRGQRIASPGLLLAKLGWAAKQQFVEVLKPIELTPSHLIALYGLRRGPMSQQALGDAVGVDPSKLVGLLNDLEADGLVLRRRDPADRRRHIVELSELGRARLGEAERAVAAVEEKLLAGLDDGQRAELLTLLRRIADNAGLEGCAEIGGVEDAGFGDAA